MSFQDKVYEIVRKVPPGKVTTYKDIAHLLSTRAYRAVGNALNRNPYWPDVPCHRVVSTDGSIGGFARGKDEKKRLLEEEGIIFDEDKIRGFQKYKKY
ncbi:MAG: MGMT family protein [Candidatus Woesearchaeota archaeon]